MEKYYELKVAGLTRHLPIMPIAPELAIASFVILGDCELVTAAAPLLSEKIPRVDYLITAEAKGIPLVNEICRLRGLPYYIVARKSVKPYMDKPLTDEVVSITTKKAAALSGWQGCPVDPGETGSPGGRCDFHRRVPGRHPAPG